MRTIVKGKNIDVPDNIRAYAERKMARLERILVDPEGEVVVLLPGRHFLANEDEDGFVPALLAAVLCSEGVVVGQQHEVQFVRPGGGGDLRHRSGAIRVGGVHVNDAGDFMKVRWSQGTRA